MPVPQVSYENRPVNPDRLSAIRRFAGKTILDVGCGNGAYVTALAGTYDIQGADQRSYDSWRGMPDRFSVQDGERLDFADASVDTVLSFETLEHLPNPLEALREYRRIARKNVIITVPNCDVSAGFAKSNLIWSHWTDRTHCQFFSMDSLAALVGEAGFRVTHREFVNEVSPAPLLLEAFGFKPEWRVSRLAARILRRLQIRRYHLTCLLVGEK